MARRRKRLIQLRLRDSDLRRARTTKFSNKKLRNYPTPELVEERYRRYFEKEQGMRVVIKSSNHLRLSKMTTTYYKELRLGSDWKNKSPDSQSRIWVHEAPHAKQWDYYGQGKFGSYYLASPRFRWGIEMPCYGEGLRWTIINLKHRKKSNKTIQRAIDEYIAYVIGVFENGYALGWIHRGDLRKWTGKILQEIAARELKA